MPLPGPPALKEPPPPKTDMNISWMRRFFYIFIYSEPFTHKKGSFQSDGGMKILVKKKLVQ